MSGAEMVSRDLIGLRLPTVKAIVEPGRLSGFRRTIGSTEHRNPMAPPTYLFALEMLEADRPLAFVEDLKVDMAAVLHSEQAFTYHAPVSAGDEITLETVITDIFEKKNGALVFVVQDTKATRRDGVHVADLRRTLVIRN
jgi:hypothetical protein